MADEFIENYVNSFEILFTGYLLYCSGFNTDCSPYNIYVRVTIYIVLFTIILVFPTIVYSTNIDKHLGLNC